VTQVIGIGGKLASGKDAIADHLVEKHGWVKFGMSDALAGAMYTLNPWIRLDAALGWRNRFTAWVARIFRRPPRPVFMKYRQLHDSVGYVHAKEQTEVRDFLQIFGTEVGRKQLSNDTLWTDIMERKVGEAVAAGAPGVVITGIRFPNEVAMLEDLEAEGWWVDRPSLKNTASTAAHASENSVSSVDFDRCVVNDGTLEDLYRKVDDLVS
jgi:hypothetical protein